MFLLRILLAAALAGGSAAAQPQEGEPFGACVIDTVAGGGQRDPQWAVEAELTTAYGIALDATDSLWAVDTGGAKVWRATPDGRISVVAGTGAPGDGGDGGPADQAELRSPRDLAILPDGTVYLTDNGKIRTISPLGIISTVEAAPVDYGEGYDNSPRLINPSFIAYEPESRRLYIAESRRVRYLDDQGRLHRLAGNGQQEGEAYEGEVAAHSGLFFVRGVLARPDGTVYLAQAAPGRVWKVDRAGRLSVVFDSADTFAIGQQGEVRWVRSVHGLAFDQSGRICFSDSTAGHVYCLEQDGSLEPITPSVPGSEQGPFYFPYDMVFAPGGEIYVSQFSKGVVRRLRPGEEGQVVVGSPQHGGDGRPATAARLASPADLSFDSLGRLYIADRDNAVVRRISEGGILERVAGNGGRRPAESFDGVAAPEASVGFVMKVDVADDGVYMLGNYRVRAARPDRSVEQVLRIVSHKQDIRLHDIVVDGKGGLFVSSYVLPHIWRFDLERKDLVVVAGNGSKGYPAEGAPAYQQPLLAPQSMTLDREGNLYFIDGVADIRRVSTDGALTTVAARPREDGDDVPPVPAAALTVDRPRALAWGPDDALYVADGARVLRIQLPDEKGPGRVRAIVGSGLAGFEGDGGPALQARLNQPYGLAFGPDGALYIADRDNHRVRRVQCGGAP